MRFSAVERDNMASCIGPVVPVPGKAAVINPVAIAAVTDVKTTRQRSGWKTPDDDRSRVARLPFWHRSSAGWPGNRRLDSGDHGRNGIGYSPSDRYHNAVVDRPFEAFDRPGCD